MNLCYESHCYSATIYNQNLPIFLVIWRAILFLILPIQKSSAVKHSATFYFHYFLVREECTLITLMNFEECIYALSNFRVNRTINLPQLVLHSILKIYAAIKRYLINYTLSVLINYPRLINLMSVLFNLITKLV